MGANKTLIIRIYQILDKYSDQDHELTQQQIIDLLASSYGIECERKAVARNIAYLQDIGCDIQSDGKGAYLASRMFERSELRLLIDSVLCSKHINSVHSKQLIDKLIALGGCGFKTHVRHVYSVKEWSKSDNRAFFLNIELADEAIESRKKIAFDYYHISPDKKPKTSGKHTGSPYQLLLHNQHYYLMLHDDKYDKVCYLRMDRIKNMKILGDDALPIDQNPGFKHGIDYGELANGLPYMYNDALVTVTLRCPNSMMDDLTDWFGTDFSVQKVDDEHFLATLRAGERAMLYWALQYNTNVEVLSPASLRDNVISALKATLKMYQND